LLLVVFLCRNKLHVLVYAKFKGFLNLFCVNLQGFSFVKFLPPLINPHPGACFRGTGQKIETNQFFATHTFCVRSYEYLSCFYDFGRFLGYFAVLVHMVLKVFLFREDAETKINLFV